MNTSDINNSPNRPKVDIIADIKSAISQLGYVVEDENTDKPWGAYFRFKNDNAEDFISRFFKDFNFPNWAKNQKLAPKFLLVAPTLRLSWQYHHRRGELWKTLKGPVNVYLSDTDDLPEKPKTLQNGEFIEIGTSKRHRLAGARNWGIVAEIWVHTD